VEVVVMEAARKVLVVANQTACGAELLREIRRRMQAGPCTFTLVVPATAPQDHATWTEGEAHDVARARMEDAVALFRREGADVKGVVGDASPVLAIADVLILVPHDEIILSTLPPGASRWLKKDLPHRVETRFGLPVTTVIGEHVPARA
jgi:hypothetical protein